MSECAICKDPIDPNGNYPLTKSGVVHWDCQKNLELASLKAKVKELEEQLESIYSVSKPHTCRGNDYDNVGYWRCILCGAKYELTKKEEVNE